ncbi:MAG: membrane protein insertase YidC [Bacteroidia bacterium]
MDRNSIIGIVLIFVILIVFSYLNAPDPSQDALAPRETDTEQVVPQKAEDEAQQIEKAKEETKPILPGDFAAFSEGEEGEVTLENEHLIMRVSRKGGTPSFVQLKNYSTFDSMPLVLFSGRNDWQFGYLFRTHDQQVNTSDLYFDTEDADIRVTGNDSASLTMRLDMGGGQRIEQTYTLHGNSYMLGYDVKFIGFDNVIPRSQQSMQILWHANLLRQERTAKEERIHTSVHYKLAEEGADYLSETSDESEEFQEKLTWIGFKQKFFTQTLISEDHFAGGKISTQTDETSDTVKTLDAVLNLPLSHSGNEHYNMALYFGPVHYETLKQYASIDLHKQVFLGWPVFREVNRFLVIPLFNALNDYIASFGIIILILTLIIKLVLSPLTYKSYLSSAKMRLLKPELDEIKKKTGGDMAKQQSAQMTLYRKAGVSPFGGCLPAILQMPILIAMYSFFPSSIELRQEPFLWASDLSTYDSIMDLPFDIPFYGSHISLFTLLMAIATFFYGIINRQMQPSMGSDGPMAAQMKMMVYLPPFMMLFFLNSYASALSYYYLLFNLFSIGQFYLFQLVIDEKKLHAQIEEKKKRPVTKSKWQARLEQMAKEQQKKQAAKK